MTSTSNIRAFVQWKEPTIFSGEDIECVITFKNTASVPNANEEETELATANNNRSNAGLRPRIERQRTVTQSTGVSRGPYSSAQSITGSSSRVPSSHAKGHRPALSLNVVPSPVLPHGRSPSASTTPQMQTSRRPAPKHSRSLSIMSMGSDLSSAAQPQKTSSISASRRPARGHGRSASALVISTSSPTVPSPAIAPFSGFPSPRQPSLSHDFTPPLPSFAQENDYLAIRPNRRRSGINTAPNTPAILLPRPKTTSHTLATDFAFPSHSPTAGNHVTTPDFEFPPRNSMPLPKPGRQRSHEKLSSSGNVNPISRVLSDESASGTPRSSSSDFYSFSNHSSEDTVASEIPALANGRLLPKPAHSRQPSRNRQLSQESTPEVLMMGYAQTIGSFTLDGSLINQAPFEEVKRKGVLGGQGGGGVVGVERSKRESGMFGAFGWGSIGESLGGLLGGAEMSSIKEMRGVASTKTIPLLSTPQSILFVDLRLAPGQSRSYTYRFQLPRGLPPTHKGRAIKVQYYIKIGVQRSGSLAGHQHVKHIEVPFRVLGSVNSRGESLGHDLMSPYIILHDQARTANVPTPDDLSLTISNFPTASATTTTMTPSSGPLQDFLDYANQLVAQTPSRGEALLSPSTELPQRRPTNSNVDSQPTNVKEAIDLAILRSNLSSSTPNQPSQSTNRFTIARAGQHVAVLSILRPAYRLGETVTGVINFLPPSSTSPQSSTAISTYAINLTLETIERIDPSLALRSSSSVQRATRKIYAHTSETVLFTHQTSFRLEIPTSATPTFETTGVGLSWRLRVEFVTKPARPQTQPARGLGISAEGDNDEVSDEENSSRDEGTTTPPDAANDLFEEVSRDERGVVLVAKERLVAETFEVAVPLRIYGVPGLGGDGLLGNGLAEALEV